MFKKLVKCLLIAFVLPGFFSPLTLETTYAPTGDGARFEHLATADGLSSDQVTMITQDTRGYIWIATNDGGLNRYDSYEITVFRHDPDDPQSLSGDLIPAVYHDSHGLLWVEAGAGLDRFDYDTETFVHYGPTEDDTRVGVHAAMNIYEGSSGAVWVTTWGAGLFRYDRETDSFVHYPINPDDPDGLKSNSFNIHFQHSKTGMSR